MWRLSLPLTVQRLSNCNRSSLLQAAELPATVCLRLLSVFDTSASEHAILQAAADRLETACFKRTRKLLAAEGPTRADTDVQAQLLRYLGPLQDMLNDKQRLKLFGGLPFETLRVGRPCSWSIPVAVCTLLPLCAASPLLAAWLIEGRLVEPSSLITLLCMVAGLRF